MKNNLFVGKVQHAFDVLPSTNDYALELLAKSEPAEGTVILADNQTAGRGQYGSRWYSAPGENLLLSVILYPHWLLPVHQWLLSEAMSLAVRDAVAAVSGKPALIKWPNDVYLDGRKTAGILIQSSLNGSHIQHVVVGIGLNVNQCRFPADVPHATSLALACGHLFDRGAVLETLLEATEHRYLQLRNGSEAAIRQAYRSHLMGLGQCQTFARPNGQRFEGTPIDVLPDGRLLVRTEKGQETYEVKEIIWILEN